MPQNVRPYLNGKWFDEDAPPLYDWYDEYTGDLKTWRALCRDVEGPILDLACGTGRVAVKRIPAQPDPLCADALATALITDRTRIPTDTLERLRPIVGQCFRGE